MDDTQDETSAQQTLQYEDPAATLALPPTDTGWRVWLFLVGCFLIETLVWGLPFSFGVLREYYTQYPPISDHPGGISAVGTTCSGIMYLAAPFPFVAFQRWPFFGHYSLFFSLPIIVLALALSSFATEVWHLVLTQGILYAVGGSFLYFPIYNYIDEWFVRRKGFAYGVLWAGSGAGGLLGPLVLQWGLDRYGAKAFLQICAVALIILVGPFLFVVRPRLPLARSHRTPMRSLIAGYGFVQSRAFWILLASVIIQGLGYFVPQLYLPAYTKTNDLPSGTLMISLLNLTNVPGVMLLSALSDYLSVYTLIMISTLGSTLSVFLFWGFSASSPSLIVLFALTYGFFAGSFTAIWAGAAKELRLVTPGGDRGRADSASVMALLSVARGIGNVICGPVSEVLLGIASTRHGYGGGYTPLIIFTGTTAALTMGSWMAHMFRLV